MNEIKETLKTNPVAIILIIAFIISVDYIFYKMIVIDIQNDKIYPLW